MYMCSGTSILRGGLNVVYNNYGCSTVRNGKADIAQ